MTRSSSHVAPMHLLACSPPASLQKRVCQLAHTVRLVNSPRPPASSCGGYAPRKDTNMAAGSWIAGERLKSSAVQSLSNVCFLHKLICMQEGEVCSSQPIGPRKRDSLSSDRCRLSRAKLPWRFKLRDEMSLIHSNPVAAEDEYSKVKAFQSRVKLSAKCLACARH